MVEFWKIFGGKGKGRIFNNLLIPGGTKIGSGAGNPQRGFGAPGYLNPKEWEVGYPGFMERLRTFFGAQIGVGISATIYGRVGPRMGFTGGISLPTGY